MTKQLYFKVPLSRYVNLIIIFVKIYEIKFDEIQSLFSVSLTSLIG